MTYGTVTNFEATATVRFEREFSVAVDRVWQALTSDAELSTWLAPATMEPGVDGRVTIDFGDDQRVNGTITEIERPHTIEYTWTFTGERDSVLRFELSPSGTGTALALEHRLLPSEQAAGYAAGWHAHLDMLGSVVTGAEVVDWDQRFDEVYPFYAGA